MKAMFFPFSRLIGALEREGYEVSGPTICRSSREVLVYDRNSGELKATVLRDTTQTYRPYVFMRQDDERLAEVAGRFAHVYKPEEFVEVKQTQES